MTKGIILFPKSTQSAKSNAFGWWLSEAYAAGMFVKIDFFEDFNPESFDKPDFVVMRGYNRDISLTFESTGTPVINTWTAMASSRDKLLAYECLIRAGIPTPESISSTQCTTFNDATSLFGPKFVVKQTDGSQGVNVFLVDSEDTFREALAKCGGTALLQRYVATSHGRDIRVWTIGKKAVAAVLRQSDTKFVSNYSQGGKASLFPMNADVASTAVKAARALGLDFAGVDILFDGNGYTVCEVNGNAGFRTLSAVSDINIIKHLYEYIHERTLRSRPA